MKPCFDQRKLITLLALGELDDRLTRKLRAHLQSCEQCRYYLEEISRVTETLAAAKTTPGIRTSQTFHRNVVARLRAEKLVSGWEVAWTFFQTSLLNWRVAVPVAAASVLLIIVLVAQRQKPGVSHNRQAQSTVQVVAAPDPNADLPPTIGNYEMVASQSLEKLDALLTEQAKKALPPAPVYTGSMLTLASLAQ
jgi:anti-sigma factor RsiW